ncbi:MAG: DUF3489 domain-containing protein [Alteraurantiacibacter sp.]
MNNKSTRAIATKVAASGPEMEGGAVNAVGKPSRLDELQTLLSADGGASIAEMITATGWQAHSVRGAMAGALKKRGLTITSEKIDGVRRYRAGAAA